MRKSTNLTPVKTYEIGWKPVSTEEMLLASIGQEVQDVLEEDRKKA